MFELNFNLPRIKLKEQIAHMHPYELSEVYNHEKDDNRKNLVKLLATEQVIQVFLYLDAAEQKDMWQLLSSIQKKYVTENCALDDLKDFVESLEEQEREMVYKHANKQTIEVLKRLLAYETTTAGSILSPHFMTVNQNSSVKEATYHVITNSNENDEIELILVVNDENQYIGTILLQELIIARANKPLHSLIDEQYPQCYDSDLITKVIKKIKDYDLSFIPVLDSEKRPIGLISAEDAFEYLEVVHAESFENMVALSDHEFDDRPFKRSYKRLPWLLISVVLNLAIAAVLQVFSPTLESFVALVMFQPLILGMAGNIGTQSLAVTILGIHSGAISAKKHMRQELIIGLINSLIIGIAGVLVVFVFLNIAPHIHAEQDLMIAVVVGLSLFGSMFLSALIGVLLPFGLRKIGVDDKIAGGPIISTFNDFVALGLYFLIATLLLVILK